MDPRILYNDWKAAQSPRKKLKVIKNASLETVCDLVREWNWDDGIDILIEIARSRNLTQFYACHIFILTGPDGYENPSNVELRSPEFELLTILHKGINSGRYKLEPPQYLPKLSLEAPGEIRAARALNYIYLPEFRFTGSKEPYKGRWRMKRRFVNIETLGLGPLLNHYNERLSGSLRVKDIDPDTLQSLFMLNTIDQTFSSKLNHYLSFVVPDSLMKGQ